MTFDPTTNRSPFVLLTREERETLKAWPHKWEYFSRSSNKWNLCVSPEWATEAIYRGLPAVTSVWQNLYADGSHAVLHPTRKLADAKCSPYRIAVLRIDTCNGVLTAHLENV